MSKLPLYFYWKSSDGKDEYIDQIGAKRYWYRHIDTIETSKHWYKSIETTEAQMDTFLRVEEKKRVIKVYYNEKDFLLDWFDMLLGCDNIDCR